MFIRSNLLCVLLLVMNASFSHSSDPLLLNKETARITDEAISSDYETIARLQKRLADINTQGTPVGTYHFAKAQAWIDMAMDEYVMNDRTTVTENSALQAHGLIVALESRKTDITMETPILPTSRIVRPDLWQKAADWKKHPGFSCGEDLVAQLEVQLVWAGHEDNQLGWRHAKPYLQAAERLARDAGKKIESCPESDRVKVAMGTAVEGGAAKAAAATEVIATPVAAVTPVEHSQAATVAASSPAATAAAAAPESASAAKNVETAAAVCAPCPECPSCPSDAVSGTVSDRVHFALNRDIISPRSAAVLQRVAAVMKANQAITIELRGHADERGHRVFNHVLSRHRAEVVRTYLISAGIERSRIRVIASGSGTPEVRGSDVVSYAKNRRVELLFSGGGGVKVEPQYEDLQIEKER